MLRAAPLGLSGAIGRVEISQSCSQAFDLFFVQSVSFIEWPFQDIARLDVEFHITGRTAIHLVDNGRVVTG